MFVFFLLRVSDVNLKLNSFRQMNKSFAHSKNDPKVSNDHGIHVLSKLRKNVNDKVFVVRERSKV